MSYLINILLTSVLIPALLYFDVSQQVSVPLQHLPTKLGTECNRDCKDDTPYHCIFNWKMKNYFIDYEDCILDPSTCFGDGVPRQTTLIMDQNETLGFIPAPAVHVCYDDVVTVNLNNEIEDHDATIHWHGLHMKEGTQVGPTPWADGVPYVTQCPISPSVNYNWYTFNAIPAGTFWFHSHSEFQRDDGALGALIVREQPQQRNALPKSIQNVLSDTCDIVEHHIMIKEWYEDLAEYRFNTNNRLTPPRSILVNGKGRSNFDSTMIPWHIFKIDPLNDGCTKYRFRLISGVDQHCPIEFSIEDHSLTVIATDGDYIEPIEDVSTIGIANGERYDFIIDTKGMEYRTYKIRFGAAPSVVAHCYQSRLSTIAFLQYGTSVVNQAEKPDLAEALNVPGNLINPLPSIVLPQFQTPIPVVEMRSVYPLSNKETADKTFYLQLGEDANGANLNNIQFDIKTLEAPLLSQENDVDQNMICDPAYVIDGILCDPFTDRHGCRCFVIVDVNVGDVVEIFLLNPHLARDIVHPLHLHGYWSNVIGSGYFPPHIRSPLEYIKQENENGNIEKNLEYPPRKDTLQSITGGYIIMRFLADNPGYWIMHCHMSFDQILGQDIIFKVGNSGDWSIPENFPKC